MFNVFNMGVGMVVAAATDMKDSILARFHGLGEPPLYELGVVRPEAGGIRLL